MNYYAVIDTNVLVYGEKNPGLLNEPEGPYYLPIPLEEINAIIKEVRMAL